IRAQSCSEVEHAAARTRQALFCVHRGTQLTSVVASVRALGAHEQDRSPPASVLEVPRILHFVGNLRPSVDPLPDPEEPIRTELFSVERLEQHAESLAAAQRGTAAPRRGWRLLPRLVDNGRALLASYRTIAEAIREERAITAAAEWLGGNFPNWDT